MPDAALSCDRNSVINFPKSVRKAYLGSLFFPFLFAELQRSDNELQLLPYAESSMLNPITASKDIPTEVNSLQEYIQIPESTNRFTKKIHIYVWFSSSQAPSLIKRNTFAYLKQNNIFFQKK